MNHYIDGETINMSNFDILYPSPSYQDYIECIYEFCKNQKLSLILKGSLAIGEATKYSDVDLIILGDVSDSIINEILKLYDEPIMTNFTENPKGILILVYKDLISVDLDIREAISSDDLLNSKVLLKYDSNFIINNKIIRKQITSGYLPERPLWYKTLRLVHRAVTKYLSQKTDVAYGLLTEIKESFGMLEINEPDFNNNFEDDIQRVFNTFCMKFDVDTKIKTLFKSLFNNF